MSFCLLLFWIPRYGPEVSFKLYGSCMHSVQGNCLNIVIAGCGGHSLYITVLLEERALRRGSYALAVRTKGGNAMNNDDTIHLRECLNNIRERGVELYLEGEPASPEEIARCFSVCEDAVYMPDFVTDERGRLREVRYDRIEYR